VNKSGGGGWSRLEIFVTGTSWGVQLLGLVLEVKPVNVPTGAIPTDCRPCTRSPLNCSLFAPDRITKGLHKWKKQAESMNANFNYYYHYYCYYYTALLVAGSTLTFWIPRRTPFASTSSYSSAVQSALGCSRNCWRLTRGLFHITHVT